MQFGVDAPGGFHAFMIGIDTSITITSGGTTDGVTVHVIASSNVRRKQ